MGFFHTIQNKRGFTFVEVLVAAAVIAILATIVYLSAGESRKKARDTQRVSDMQQLAIAFRLYRDLNLTNPTAASGEILGDGAGTVDTAIAPYLTNTIKDPTDSGTSRYYYDSSYTCNGVSRAVIFARTMERTSAGNYVSVCGPVASASDIGMGVTPTANTYIMILQ